VYRSRRQRKEDEANEKIELLARISGLSKNGFQPTKKFALADDLDEIRYECYKLQRESNLKKSTKLMQKVMVSVTAFVEMANSKFDPFSLQLDGFSKAILMSINEYDDIFEQLHHKYSGRSKLPVELQLLFGFGSAAIFHHASNALKSKVPSGSRSSGSSGSSGSSAHAPVSTGLMDMMKMGGGGLGFGSSGTGGNNSSNMSPMAPMTPASAHSASGPLMKGLSVSAPLPALQSAQTEGAPAKRRAMKGPSGGAAPSMFLDPGKNSIMETLSGMM